MREKITKYFPLALALLLIAMAIDAGIHGNDFEIVAIVIIFAFWLYRLFDGEEYWGQ